ncbi:MAG: M14 family metallopeptidase [Cyclobacteriaceae bacterium]|nr:M14 family metallopeptidase [Cyclobacteriaceae bacterium]
MRISIIITLIFVISNVFAQSIKKATHYDFPQPVDTKDHPITEQEKKQYAINGVYFDNRFDVARVNDVVAQNDSTFRITLRPENEPINSSPWYAFKVHADSTSTIYIELDYEEYKHRYYPKLSNNGMDWNELDNKNFTYIGDSSKVLLKLKVSSDTLLVAAQEIISSQHVSDWCEKLESNSKVHLQTIGKSIQGRSLLFMDLYEGDRRDKKVIVLLSRQHPPEVTGYMALQSFVQEILDNPLSDDFLKTYRIMIYPLLNPDGVDMGHWRHNYGGIDLNRDWAYYHQPETRQIADHIVSEVNSNNNQVVLGLDFHSTWHDVYYTLPKDTATTNISGFRNNWFASIESTLGEGYKINEKPSGLGKPVTKGWFFTQFGAEGITYEIGDDTSREFIKKKGKVSAATMMEVLMRNK